MAFRKFAEWQRPQVTLRLCDEDIKMPVIVYSPRGRTVEWRLPRYNTIHRLLTNPIYAGAYVFGRTGSQVRVEAGRELITRGIRRSQNEWEVPIRDHHAGYISWEDYESNLRTIDGNANMKGEMVPGSVRNGGGLLIGLLRCGIEDVSSRCCITGHEVSRDTYATMPASITGDGRSVSHLATCASMPRCQPRYWR